MAQTIRLTITSELEKALDVLRQSTSGTLNATELVKMAVGELANMKAKKDDISPEEWDLMSARQFYRWAKEDGTLEVDNIAHPEKLKPFVPKHYVRPR